MTADGKLSVQECLALAALQDAPGWAVYKAVVAREMENLGIDLENTSPVNNANAVLDAHAKIHHVRAFWKDLEKIVTEAVDHGIEASSAKPREITQDDRDAAILDATVRITEG